MFALWKNFFQQKKGTVVHRWNIKGHHRNIFEKYIYNKYLHIFTFLNTMIICVKVCSLCFYLGFVDLKYPNIVMKVGVFIWKYFVDAPKLVSWALNWYQLILCHALMASKLMSFLRWSNLLKDRSVLLFSSFVHNSWINEYNNMKLRENICYEMINWILHYCGLRNNLQTNNNEILL